MSDTTLDRARAAVMHQMGWEDDRNATEWAGAIWDAATDVAQAVLDSLSDAVPERPVTAVAVEAYQKRLQLVAAAMQLREPLNPSSDPIEGNGNA